MMKQLIILLLIAAITLLSSNLFSQERRNLVRIRAPLEDDINPTYTGKWGWHKVHKKVVRNTVKKFQNGASLRKKDMCSKCHNKNGYKIFDPHTQITAQGDMLKEKCLYCHPDKPDEKNATFAKGKEIKFVNNLKELCMGCHSKEYDLAHPVNAKHVGKPSDEMIAMMKDSERQFGIILPLNYQGEIMCATCHNPHERGVIPIDKSAAQGASEIARVRLTGEAESTEQGEHNKDILLISSPDGNAAAKDASENYNRLPGQSQVAVAKRESDVEFRITGTVNTLCLTCHKDKTITDISKKY
jgi:cytochrome c553